MRAIIVTRADRPMHPENHLSRRFLKLFSRFLALVLMLAAGAGRATAEKPKDLKPTDYVNDFAGVLSGATQQRLNQLCSEVEQKAHAQIAVAIIKSLDGADIDSFSVELYKQWGVGDKKENRGVLVVLAVNDHKYRTEVGYGLEPILPDGKVGGFGREMVPLLRQNDYDGAITHITWSVAKTIADDAGVQLTGAPSQRRARRQQNSPAAFIISLLIFLFLLRMSMRRGVSPLLLGGMGGGWGGGGSGWSGGGGGGGFGGFGGGMSGGGGASGGW